MKNSGVEWIGQIPEDWRKIRLKCLFIDRTSGAWGDEAKNNDGDRVCIRVADFDFGTQTIKDGNKTLRNYEQKTIERLKLEENDLLIEKSGGGEKTPVGRTIIATGCRGFLFANFIDRLRIRSEHSPKYIAYFFRALYYNGATNPYIKQTTGIQNLDIENLLRETVFVPSCAIQQRIADFLDAKCAKIDNLIANQQAQIEKLKEYKQAVITEAVTKGLDKTVPMKDSGILHIGDIPADWETIKHKYILKKKKEICDKYNNQKILSLSVNGVIVRDLDNPFGKMPTSFDGYQQVFKNNLLLCLFDIDVTPRCVGLIKDNGLTSPAYSQYEIISKDYVYYFYYLLLALDFNKALLYLSKNLRSSLSDENFGLIETVIPPINEQKAIVEYLDDKCSNIDNLISIKQQKIEKLQEYKKSLIYELVTGKKEVV